MVMVGELGASRTVVNAAQAVAQDAQRFEGPTLTAASTAGTTYYWTVARVDRPVKVIEVRVCPGGALTADNTNYAGISYEYTNDGGGSAVVMGSVNTKVTGTNSWLAQQSFVVTANAAINAVIPAGSFIYIKSAASGGGVAIPAGTRFQMLWEEV